MRKESFPDADYSTHERLSSRDPHDIDYGMSATAPSPEQQEQEEQFLLRKEDEIHTWEHQF